MYLYLLSVFIFGLLIGSFINVCIYRIPKEQSIIAPRSACPVCRSLICWYDNIPIVSFIILGGKCRHCRAKISFQYPLIEIITGLTFLFLAVRYPLKPVLIVYLYLSFVLITISGIDFFYRLIPDFFSFSLILTGLFFSFLNYPLGFDWKMRLLNSVSGGLAGFMSLFIIGFVGEKIMHQEVMGGGDIKLLCGIGTILGLGKILSTLFIASFIGAITGIILLAIKKIQRKEYIPFGPFLALAAYINLFLPDPAYFLNQLLYPRILNIIFGFLKNT